MSSLGPSQPHHPPPGYDTESDSSWDGQRHTVSAINPTHETPPSASKRERSRSVCCALLHRLSPADEELRTRVLALRQQLEGLLEDIDAARGGKVEVCERFWGALGMGHEERRGAKRGNGGDIRGGVKRRRPDNGLHRRKCCMWGCLEKVGGTQWEETIWERKDDLPAFSRELQAAGNGMMKVGRFFVCQWFWDISVQDVKERREREREAETLKKEREGAQREEAERRQLEETQRKEREEAERLQQELEVLNEEMGRSRGVVEKEICCEDNCIDRAGDMKWRERMWERRGDLDNFWRQLEEEGNGKVLVKGLQVCQRFWDWSVEGVMRTLAEDVEDVNGEATVSEKDKVKEGSEEEIVEHEVEADHMGRKADVGEKTMKESAEEEPIDEEMPDKVEGSQVNGEMKKDWKCCRWDCFSRVEIDQWRERVWERRGDLDPLLEEIILAGFGKAQVGSAYVCRNFWDMSVHYVKWREGRLTSCAGVDVRSANMVDGECATKHMEKNRAFAFAKMPSPPGAKLRVRANNPHYGKPPTAVGKSLHKEHVALVASSNNERFDRQNIAKDRDQTKSVEGTAQTPAESVMQNSAVGNRDHLITRVSEPVNQNTGGDMNGDNRYPSTTRVSDVQEAEGGEVKSEPILVGNHNGVRLDVRMDTEDGRDSANSAEGTETFERSQVNGEINKEWKCCGWNCFSKVDVDQWRERVWERRGDLDHLWEEIISAGLGKAKVGSAYVCRNFWNMSVDYAKWREGSSSSCAGVDVRSAKTVDGESATKHMEKNEVFAVAMTPSPPEDKLGMRADNPDVGNPPTAVGKPLHKEHVSPVASSKDDCDKRPNIGGGHGTSDIVKVGDPKRGNSTLAPQSGEEDVAIVSHGGDIKQGIDTGTASGGCGSETDDDQLIPRVQDYTGNEYVAVLGDPDDTTPEFPFWIGRVRAVKRDERGVATNLHLHWYEVVSGKAAVTARYAPLYLRGKRKRSPSMDWVHVETVLMAFNGISKDGSLTSQVREELEDRMRLQPQPQ